MVELVVSQILEMMNEGSAVSHVKGSLTCIRGIDTTQAIPLECCAQSNGPQSPKFQQLGFRLSLAVLQDVGV